MEFKPVPGPRPLVYEQLCICSPANEGKLRSYKLTDCTEKVNTEVFSQSMDLVDAMEKRQYTAAKLI